MGFFAFVLEALNVITITPGSRHFCVDMKALKCHRPQQHMSSTEILQNVTLSLIFQLNVAKTVIKQPFRHLKLPNYGNYLWD